MSVEDERNGGHGFFWFVIGVLLGVAGAIMAPRWAAPYLPSFLGGGADIEGRVLEKLSESDRILVKVSTTDGLVLVTFTQSLEELDLLIGEGDSITLGMDGYQTLVENPTVARVIRSGETAAVPSRGESENGTDAMEDFGEDAEPSAPAGPSTSAMPSANDSGEDEESPSTPPAEDVTEGEDEPDSPGSTTLDDDESTEAEEHVP